MTLKDFLSNKPLMYCLTLLVAVSVGAYVFLSTTGHSAETVQGVRYIANAFNTIMAIVGLGSVALRAKTAAEVTAVKIDAVQANTVKALNGVMDAKLDKALGGALDAKLEPALTAALETHANTHPSQ